MYAAISADVVSSTSLSRESMIELNEKLKKCLYILERRYQGFWGRIVKGDSIECVMNRPEDAFEVALILKRGLNRLSLAIYKRTSDLIGMVLG